MIIISHRGNLTGPSKKENTIEAWYKYCEVDKRGASTYCELDLWYRNGKYWTGHDKPMESRVDNLLLHEGILWHCKNFDACNQMSLIGSGHFFFHENDPHTMTSKGWIWAYPREQVNAQTIIVCQSLESTISTIKDGRAMGVCTDYFVQALEAIA